MAFVIDKNGEYLPVLGETSGGGGGGYVLPTASTSTLGGVKIDDDSIKINASGVISASVDNELKSTSTHPVQNQIIYPSLSNFIPANTIISVASDGDFTSLGDAVSFLNGKWSNGTVNISIGAGSFTVTETIEIDTTKFSIPHLSITGDSVANTQFTYNLNTSFINILYSGFVTLKNFTCTCTGTAGSLIRFMNKSNAYIENITLIGNNKTQTNGISAWRNTNLEIGDYITIKNVANAVGADQGGKVFAGVMSNSEFNNCTNGWFVANGSIISGLGGTTPTYTNVTNKLSQTANAIASGGIIFRIPT